MNGSSHTPSHGVATIPVTFPVLAWPDAVTGRRWINDRNFAADVRLRILAPLFSSMTSPGAWALDQTPDGMKLVKRVDLTGDDLTAAVNKADKACRLAVDGRPVTVVGDPDSTLIDNVDDALDRDPYLVVPFDVVDPDTGKVQSLVDGHRFLTLSFDPDMNFKLFDDGHIEMIAGFFRREPDRPVFILGCIEPADDDQ